MVRKWYVRGSQTTQKRHRAECFQGLDLSKLIAEKRLIYIDGLIDTKPAGDANPGVQRFNYMSSKPDAIESAIRRVTSHSPPSTAGVTLVIESIDLLLALNPNVSAMKLSRMLLGLRKDFDSMTITCSADAPLLHNDGALASPLEREHLAFITTMAHQSSLIMQLRTLDTGAAKDVSGVLRISHGGSTEPEEEIDFPEGEWLYQVKGDGNVRVWSRGE